MVVWMDILKVETMADTTVVTMGVTMADRMASQWVVMLVAVLDH